jgi:hypothetical protein
MPSRQPAKPALSEVEVMPALLFGTEEGYASSLSFNFAITPKSSSVVVSPFTSPLLASSRSKRRSLDWRECRPFDRTRWVPHVSPNLRDVGVTASLSRLARSDEHMFSGLATTARPGAPSTQQIDKAHFGRIVPLFSQTQNYFPSKFV